MSSFLVDVLFVEQKCDSKLLFFLVRLEFVQFAFRQCDLEELVFLLLKSFGLVLDDLFFFVELVDEHFLQLAPKLDHLHRRHVLSLLSLAA